MKGTKRTGVIAALAVIGILAGALPASAYWISPWRYGEVSNYNLDGALVSTDITLCHDVEAWESGGQTWGDIGLRTEYDDGLTKPIKWRASVVEIVRTDWANPFWPCSGDSQLWRYKVYHD